MWVVYNAETGEIVKAEARLADFFDHPDLAEIEVADNQFQPNFYHHINELVPKPAPVYEILPHEFLLRFTQGERIAIEQTEKNDPEVYDALFILQNSPFVDVKSELIGNFLLMFVSKGL